MRRRFARLGALWVAVVTAALLLTGPLHLVLERHVWCPAHGELVRAHDEADHAFDAGPGPRTPGRPSLPHDHEQDRCAWALILQAPGAPASVTTANLSPVGLVVAPVFEPQTPPAPPIAVLAFAPSHSPPSSAV